MSERQECNVCPHGCSISPGSVGICGARGNEGGRIVSINFGMATALALDPIEKKPLAMFHRGSQILSYGSFGCNMRCPFCQNSDIATMSASEALADGDGPLGRRAIYLSPMELALRAKELEPSGNIGVAFTYNEPLISPEFVMDACDLLHERGLLAVAVTNGYFQSNAFDAMVDCIDAFNIDLKCFSESGYERLGAPFGLHAVKRSISSASNARKHVEVTTLVVPGLSDDALAFEEECRWLASVDPDIPLHITRFFPRHDMSDSDPTDIGLMREFESIARGYLEHVLLGNV